MDNARDGNLLKGVHVTIPEHLLAQKVDDGLVLLDLHGGRYYGLDTVGARVWELLTESGDVEAAVQTMLSEYDVRETQLREDLERLLRAFQKGGLVHVHAEAD